MAPPPPMPQPALPPMREVTEDTPPDMLAGNMDLRVLLPDGHAVKMNVDRSTPMMDLLVHVTTANKMSPGSHVIQAVGEKGNILPYKPSTPIGALDTWTIQVVSKSKTSGVGHKKAPLKPSNQPFEQTFRLQVNLPRNQLFVTRVSPRTPLVDVLRHVCSEKGLDPEKYDLRNPMNPDEVLCLTSNLFDYKLQEVTVALRGSTVPHNHHSRHRIHATSTADIISLQHHQQLADVGDKRRKSSGSTTTTNNSSGGVFGFIFKRGSRSSVCEGSVSSDSLGGHSISPARSDESLGPTRSVSPPLSHPVPRTVGASQDQLRNHINSQMSRRQDSTPRPISLSGDKKLKSPMEEGQPPPPPIRHRKRRAPKPPAQTSLTEGKITSEFITPAPPSEPAPIPVSRRKSGPIDDEEDEYEEEDIVVGDGRRGNHVGKGKGNHVGSASTGTTIISHSRNSSDSSGYHEASVLSESPESGVGGSGAPDTLPRRKQQQQMQRSSGCVNSQLPPFSRSMGNLAASNGPPSSVSTASSKTMMSSSSYSSLSASTSSLPGQKKKKAPAPPPPVVPAAAAPPKQSVVAEVHQRVDAPVKNSVPARKNSVEGKSQVLNGKRAEEEVVNSHAVVEQPKSKPQSKNPVDQNSIPVISQGKPQLPHENHHDSSSSVKPAVCPVGPASKPAASVTKPGPAVAPKPQSKVNSSADLPRPMSYKSQDTENVREAGDGSEVASNADTTDSMTVDSIDEVDCSRQQAIDSAFEETEKLLQPLDNNMIEKDRVYSHVEKMNGVDVTPTVLPSPPPSLEYMGPDVGKPSEAEGRVESVVETSDLDWEYKLPAPPSGFQDEDERRDGVEEVPAMMSGKKADERETWVAESETASIPSTFSSTASHRKIPTVEMDNLPAQHLPNFRMSTYKASSEDGGWEDPREEFNHRKVVDDCFGRSNGRTFVMLNSDGEAHSEKSFREPRKNSYETWASVSSKSSLSKGHYSNLDLSNPSPYGNTSLVMTSFKDPAQNGYEPNGVMNNGSYVVRVSSFGGKSAMALKRSLSSTSSLVSRHSSNDGREVAEKYERELAGNVVRSHVHMMNGMDNHLSNASRTVSLHDLAVNRIQEERKAEDHAKNGYHDENTTPKIVSSKWKKPQAVNGGPGTKFGPKKFNNIQNLRKTSSELSINQGYTNGWKDVKDEDSVASRQFSHWQDHIALETQMQEPLKSIQVLRGVLPHLKKSLSSDLIEHDQHEKVKEVAIHKVDTKEANGIEGVPEKDSMDESQLLRTKSHSLPRPSEHHQPSSDGMHQEEEEEETPKRYSYTGPPAINFGTWNERPKSEVSIKRDSDYRIGVGQAPRSRESFALPSPAHSQPSPPAIPHKSVVSNGNHHHNPPSASPPVENGPPCPPPKPAMNNRVTVNIVSASKPEPVSRLPIVRSVELKKTVSAVQLRNKPEHASQARPVSCKFPSDLREELSGALASLVDANRNSEMRQGAEEVNERRRRQQIPTESVPPPPPPPDTSASSGVNLRRAGSAVGSQDAGGPNVRVNGFMGHEKRQSGILFAPVVKGFRLNSVPPQSSLPAQAAAQPSQPSVAAVQPPPPPPPAVVCGVALKKKPVMPSGPKVLENPRDQLLVAIREFGGKDSLKKTALRYK
ncbi:uncharacterized protein LOC124164272 isoform X2 [Ischnura elegans]|uniref:uncharacterized protein LOC124164272 isoform X2 n=1 Tax=Ischnura elegans TaxID=197161 RepID=UPI001ED89FEB|nr:uncharacterized protein LOC124164272 isoform X2 [Ischnura elegans]